MKLNVRRPRRGEAVFLFKKVAGEKHQPLANGESFQALLEVLPERYRDKKTILGTVSAYYLKKGYDYVARNVLYTNQCCTDNYRAYLAKFLKEEWVLALQEDEEEVLFYNLSKQGKKAEMERKAMMPFRMCGNISSSYH